MRLSLVFFAICFCGAMQLQAQNLVVINEFSAWSDSLSSISDPAGQTDDWVELHNKGGISINLSQWYLTDSIAAPTIWKFPTGVTIAANGYLIVWCDEDPMQEGLHASFKLGKDGEEIALSNADSVIQDQFVFGQQTLNKSMARIPNATGVFLVGTPTFNTNNSTVGSNDRKNTTLPLRLINAQNMAPAIVFEANFDTKVQINVTDLQGRALFGQTIDAPQAGQQFTIDGYWAPGVYVVQILTPNAQQALKIIRI